MLWQHIAVVIFVYLTLFTSFKSDVTRSPWSRQKPPFSRQIQVVQSGATNSSNVDWLRAVASQVVVTCIHETASALLCLFPSATVRVYVPVTSCAQKWTQWHERTTGTIWVKHKTGHSEEFKMVLESISRIIKVQLPAYLKKLPLPESIGGFARLTGNERQLCCTSDCPVKMTSELLGDALQPISLYL